MRALRQAWAQAGDIDFERVAAAVALQPFPCDGAALGQHQRFQNVPLPAGQCQGRAVECCKPSSSVERQWSERKLEAAIATTPLHCPHSRSQFGQFEGLGEIVVGAEVESIDAVVEGVASSDEDDRYVLTAAADATHDLVASQSR